MNRNAKSLQVKSRSHEVIPQGDSTFCVISGSSGDSYTVFLRADGDHRCVAHNRDKLCFNEHTKGQHACSHILAAADFVEVGHSLSFWSNEDDARRQHRPMCEISPGLIATIRRDET